MCEIFEKSEFDFEEAVAQKEMEQWQINQSREYEAIDIYTAVDLKPGDLIEWISKPTDLRVESIIHSGVVMRNHAHHVLVRCWCPKNNFYNVSLNKIDIFIGQVVIKNYMPSSLLRESNYDFSKRMEKLFG